MGEIAGVNGACRGAKAQTAPLKTVEAPGVRAQAPGPLAICNNSPEPDSLAA